MEKGDDAKNRRNMEDCSGAGKVFHRRWRTGGSMSKWMLAVLVIVLMAGGAGVLRFS